MKTKGKFLTLLLSALMVFGTFPSMVFAESTESVVAKIGDQEFGTLADAVKAVPTDGTKTKIVLLSDISDAAEDIDYITIDEGRNVELDMNGHSLAISSYDYGPFTINGGSLELSGTGTVQNTYTEDEGGFWVVRMKSAPDKQENYSVFTQGKDVDLIGVDKVVYVTRINDSTNYGTVVNLNGRCTSEDDVVYVHGNVNNTEYAPIINFGSTAKIEQENYIAGYAVVNVAEGATFTSDDNCIDMAAGELNVNGGSFTGGNTISYVPGGGGSIDFDTCCAVYVRQHSTNLPIKININNGVFKSAVPFWQATGMAGSPKPEDITLNISGGRFVSTADEEQIAVKSDDKTGFIHAGLYSVLPDSKYIASNCVAAEISGGDYHYIVGIDAASTDKKLTAGKFNINPIAYVADTYTVAPSDNRDYPYEVIKQEGEDQERIVVDKPIEADVSKTITNEDEIEVAKTALEQTDVTGVANAVSDNGQDIIIAAAIADKSPVTEEAIDEAKQIDISITVKAKVTVSETVTEAKETRRLLCFELVPYAVVTATDSLGNQVQSYEIKVDNECFNKQGIESITVKLGAAFEPKQVLHIKSDKYKTAEKFKKGDTASYEDRTFAYNSSDKTVTLEIKDFSEVQLLATEKYVNLRFDANGGTGSMDTVSIIPGQYNLPKNRFVAPEGKVFAGWEIDEQLYEVGDTVYISGETVIYAKWNDIPKPKKVAVSLLHCVTSGDRAVALSWNKIKGATKYVIYGARCDQKFKKLKTTTGTSFTVKSIAGKKLKAHQFYRFYVVAYTPTGKVQSKAIHFIVAKTKGVYSNVVSIKAKKAKMTMHVGDTGQVGATYRVYLGKKHLNSSHGKALRYTSDCPKVVSVSSSGKLKAKQAGTATIYIQDIGGKSCKTVVTVK
ncbi:MAG: hypothetical protein MJ145_04060 [Clostridia bacterium]|nr:hypothetical protein [Clostridia bacterium]